jgi:hypothetical protein
VNTLRYVMSTGLQTFLFTDLVGRPDPTDAVHAGLARLPCMRGRMTLPTPPNLPEALA